MSRFNADYSGIGEMLCAPWMVAEMRRRGEKVLATAVASAPDQPPYGEGYVAAFEIESGIRQRKTKRAFCTVRNTSPHAIYVEFGAGNTPKHRTLGKALDAARD